MSFSLLFAFSSVFLLLLPERDLFPRLFLSRLLDLRLSLLLDRLGRFLSLERDLRRSRLRDRSLRPRSFSSFLDFLSGERLFERLPERPRDEDRFL